MINEYASRKRTKKLREDLRAALMREATASGGVKKAISEIQAANTTITNLRDDANERAAELSRANVTIEEQAHAIATFKEEHLTLMLEVAEMRGYISRTLEDDAVREQGPLNAVKGTMDDADRNHLIERLRHDDNARRQPAKPVRQGPSAMHPQVACDTYTVQASYLDPLGQRERPRPKNWTAR